MYKCEIITDSLSPQKHRLTTFKVTYPRIIHAEFLRNRMLSRNVASSRAIPFKKMVKDVEENPFIPIAWQKDHKGMQGTEYFKGGASECVREWLIARDAAIDMAERLNSGQVTKQLCNRLLEPFVWTTELITATEWDNFFELRCPKYDLGEYGIFKSKKDAIDYCDGYDASWLRKYSDINWLKINKSQAEIHIQKIAEMIWDAYNESKPKQLKAGEWHIPFGDNIDSENFVNNNIHTVFNNGEGILNNSRAVKLQIATARCARLSYETLGDNPKIDYEADIKLHGRLLKNEHMSPFEHCARAMDDDEYTTFVKGIMLLEDQGDGVKLVSPSSHVEGWCNNFRGFIQYRVLIF